MSLPNRRLLAACALGAALLAPAPLRAQIPGLSPTPTPAAEVAGRPVPPRDAVRLLLRLHARGLEGELDRRGRVPPVAEGLEDASRADGAAAEGRPRRALRRRPREAEPFDARRRERRTLGRDSSARAPSSGGRSPSTSSSCGRPRRRAPPSGSSRRRRSGRSRRRSATSRHPSSTRVMPAPLRRNVAGSLRVWQVLAFWLLVPVACFSRAFSSAIVLRPPPARRRPRAFPEGLAAQLDRFRGPLALLAAVPLHAAAVARLGLPLLGRYNYARLWRLLLVAGVAWLLIRVIALPGLTRDAAPPRVGRDGRLVADDRPARRPGNRRLRRLPRRPRHARRQPHGDARRPRDRRHRDRVRGAEEPREPLRRRRRPVGQDPARRRRREDRGRAGRGRGRHALRDAHPHSRADRRLDPERDDHDLPDREPQPARQVPVPPHARAALRDDRRADAGGARRLPGAARGRPARRVRDAPRAVPEARTPYTLDVEVFAYVLAPDWAAFLAAQEELLLALMQAVEEAGSGFAFPTQTTYLASEAKGARARSRTSARPPAPR